MWGWARDEQLSVGSAGDVGHDGTCVSWGARYVEQIAASTRARESEVCVSSSECGDNRRPQNWEKQSWQSRGAACGRVTAWANWALLPDNILLRSHWFSFPRIIHTVTFSLCCATQSPHTQKLCNYAALFILTIIKERSYFFSSKGALNSSNVTGKAIIILQKIYLKQMLLFWTFIHQRMLKNYVCTKLLSGNIDNNKKNNKKIISEGSHDTKDHFSIIEMLL